MDLQTRLYEKAKTEQGMYVSNLLQRSPQEVLDHAYEKVIRDDILMIFENDDLSDKHVKQLLKLKNPLAECYDKWLKTDCSHMDMLKSTIEDFGERLAAENMLKKKKSGPER